VRNGRLDRPRGGHQTGHTPDASLPRCTGCARRSRRPSQPFGPLPVTDWCRGGRPAADYRNEIFTTWSSSDTLTSPPPRRSRRRAGSPRCTCDVWSLQAFRTPRSLSQARSKRLSHARPGPAVTRYRAATPSGHVAAENTKTPPERGFRRWTLLGSNSPANGTFLHWRYAPRYAPYGQSGVIGGATRTTVASRRTKNWRWPCSRMMRPSSL
jgi:hypothetical protein